MAGAVKDAEVQVGARGWNDAAEDDGYRTTQMKRRKQLLDKKVAESRSTWVHPRGRQVETAIFHRIRALISLTGLSQSLICSVTWVSPAGLSLYLRSKFCGSQGLL